MMKTILSTSLLTTIFLISMYSHANERKGEETCQNKIENLKINQYQTIGSHNSYRKNTQAEIIRFIKSSTELLPKGFDPSDWDYTHETIEDQLNIYGLRSFEFDVYRDPNGGLFKKRLGNAFVGLDQDVKEEKLANPGLKVLHFPDFDYHTHFITFIDALHAIKSWSINNPKHLPITILVEAKEDNPALMLPGFGLSSTFEFTGNAVNEIENEISKVFSAGSDHILKPGDVRGNKLSLRDAVTTSGWPSIGESRGKIMLVLMARDEVVDHYIDNHSSHAGRLMFVFTHPENDEAAFLNINDPEAELSEIQKFVEQGFMVRTRADADTKQARTGSDERMKSAFASGAQIISTDYYRPDPRFLTDSNWTDYHVKIDNNKLAVIRTTVASSLAIDCEIEE